MSAVGIDFGNENCYVAVARAGGIETVTNDYSQRATPAYVAFHSTCREVGTSAKNKVITNLKNTIFCFKRLIGKKFYDRTLQHEISYIPFKVHEMNKGHLGVEVSYLGKKTTFSIQQIAAMLLTKLRNITEAEVGTKVTDCVISVPSFFTDSERRAMLDICQIVNLNVLRLLNETTAVALAYGFYKQDLSDSKPKKVVFVDIGFSATQACVCEFYQGRLKVLCNTWDCTTGGRDMDNSIARYFSQEFATKYNISANKNERAIIRLLQECEKLKKQLSANPHVLPLNIECFVDDKDVSSSLGRDKLEELLAEHFIKIEGVFRKLLSETNLSPKDISAVEVVGGSTRIPAIRNIIKKVFGMEPSTTLNLDEAVARGCAIQAAMLLPNVKVKDFSITDSQPFSLKVTWNISKTEKGDIEVFPKSHPIPFSKLLTFFRKEDFALNVFCKTGNENELFLGSFAIRNVQELPSGESAKIIVKLRVDINGIFKVCYAVIADKDSKENLNIDQKTEELLDLKSKNSSLSPDPVIAEEKKNFFSLKKHKKTPQEVELQIESQVPQLSELEIDTFTAVELQMIEQDKNEEKRINAKNSLEEYVYELKSLLSDELTKYLDKQEYDNCLHKLNQTEEWIYEDGLNENESIYQARLSDLKSMVDPIHNRKYEHDHRLIVITEMQKMHADIKSILAAYLSGDQQYSHIESKEMEQVQRSVDEHENWLRQQLKILDELKMHESSPVPVQAFLVQKEKLRQEVFPILNKPKPPEPVDSSSSDGKIETV